MAGVEGSNLSTGIYRYVCVCVVCVCGVCGVYGVYGVCSVCGAYV